MFRHRSFWVILLITAVVWVSARMSEHDNYPLQVRLLWQGYDTARYAVVQADTTIPLVINSNCFLAISRHFTVKRTPFVIQTQGDTVLQVNNRLFDEIVSQLDFVGPHGVTSPAEKLTFRISDMTGRTISTESVENYGGEMQHTLNVSNLSKGLYLLSIEGKQGTSVHKFIVE